MFIFFFYIFVMCNIYNNTLSPEPMTNRRAQSQFEQIVDSNISHTWKVCSHKLAYVLNEKWVDFIYK